jgi:glycosyltransferase involved in cell wall biosynthesis
MTKISYISSYPPMRGRLSEYAYSFVNELQRLHSIEHIDVITDTLEGPEIQDLNEKVTIHRTWKSDSPLSMISILLKIMKLKPDIVHFNVHMAVFGRSRIANFAGLSLPFLCRVMGFKTVATLHNIIDKIDVEKTGYRNTFLNRMSAFMVTKLIALSSVVTLTMKSHSDFFKQRYNCKHTETIPHGTWKNNSYNREHILKSESILYVGHSGPYKDLDLLFDAFRLLETKKRGLKLIVAGTSHPNYPGFLKNVRRHNNFENVLFTGYVPEDQLQALFEKANAVILPYHTCTGTSGVAHLASSYGTPIVATDLPEFRELAREGCGLLISQHRPEALAEKIEEIIDNPTLALKLKERNFTFANQRCWDNIASQFSSLYDELLKE